MQQPPTYPNWQQPPMMPPVQPPKKSRKKLWLIIAGVVLVMAMCGGIMNALGIGGSPTTTQTQAATATTAPTTGITPQPTKTPTLKPTPTLTRGHAITTHGRPQIGGPVSDFVGKYGQPDTGCATCESGIYNFQRIQGTQIDYISTMLTDANGHVNGFIVQGPNAGWDTTTATAICESFGPSDVNYDHPLKVLQSSDGSTVEKVYKSAWLAGQLAVSDFQDGNTTSNNTDLPPGTFDIDYTYPSNPSNVSDCSLEAGIQRV